MKILTNIQILTNYLFQIILFDNYPNSYLIMYFFSIIYHLLNIKWFNYYEILNYTK